MERRKEKEERGEKKAFVPSVLFSSLPLDLSRVFSLATKKKHTSNLSIERRPSERKKTVQGKS